MSSVVKISRITYYDRPVLGEMNQETYAKMNMPRCGMSDNGGHAFDVRRKKRYSLGPEWTKTDLTYRIDNTTPDLSPGEVIDTIERAFKVFQS